MIDFKLLKLIYSATTLWKNPLYPLLKCSKEPDSSEKDLVDAGEIGSRQNQGHDHKNGGFEKLIAGRPAAFVHFLDRIENEGPESIYHRAHSGISFPGPVVIAHSSSDRGG